MERNKIYEAALKGELDRIMESVSKADPELSFVAERDEWGLTLLHWAVATGQRRTAELLVSMGADINARSNNGWRPLKLAQDAGDREMAYYLEEKGARR